MYAVPLESKIINLKAKSMLVHCPIVLQQIDAWKVVSNATGKVVEIMSRSN